MRSRTCLAIVSGKRTPVANNSRTRSTGAWSGAGAVVARAGSTAGGSGASRSKSRNSSDNFTPPSPSTMVWCSFSMSALLPPFRPSTTTNCHNGRVRSYGSLVMSEPRSSSCRIVPGLGSAMCRTCWRRSKLGSSTHTGLATPGCTRCRSRGMVVVARSMRRSNRSKSGGRSSSVMLAKVLLRCGSFSRRHISASASLILRSKTGISVMRRG